MKKEFKKKLIQAKIELSPPPSKSTDLDNLYNKILTIRTTGYTVSTDLIQVVDSDNIPGIYYHRLDKEPKAIIDDKNQVHVKIDQAGNYTGTWRMSKEDFEKAITDYISKFEFVDEELYSMRKLDPEEEFKKEYKVKFLDNPGVPNERI
jgi:hypothetical protein